jgi:cytidylate kinase
MSASADPVVIAIDGTSASGKSSNARRIAKALNFLHVDTGAMYRSLAWYCLRAGIDLHNAQAVTRACRKWKTSLDATANTVRLLVDGHYPADELHSAEVTAGASLVATNPKVRLWMKQKHRECIQFGNLVMEGRDIGSNVFPETSYKYYLDANLEERGRRRTRDGLEDNLVKRDHQDSRRASAPLMMGLGARLINTSQMTLDQTSALILEDIRRKMSFQATPRSRAQQAFAWSPSTAVW